MIAEAPQHDCDFDAGPRFGGPGRDRWRLLRGASSARELEVIDLRREAVAYATA